MSRIVKDLPPIIVDTREQLPFSFNRYRKQYGVEVKSGTLYTGDYSLDGLDHVFAVERKSGLDLIASLSGGRERFEREFARGLALENFCIITEVGYRYVFEHEYRTNMRPHSVLQSAIAWQTRGVQFVFAESRPYAAYLTFWYLEKCYRKYLEQQGAQACLID